MCAAQDLVEVLSDPEIWLTPRKVDQAAFERKSDGSFAGFERTPPFEYHNGYLTVHYAINNYLEVKEKLTPLQEEAVWWVHVQLLSNAFCVIQCVCVHHGLRS